MTGPAGRARLDVWRDRRLQPLAFTLDGVRYEVGEHPARVWALGVLAAEPADLLLDVLPEADADELWDDALDPDSGLTPALLHTIGRRMLAAAAGRPWWQAERLLATYAADWDVFIGVARDRGLGDPEEWPVADLCAWIYLRLTQGASKEDRARLDTELATPPLPAGGAEEEEEEDSGWVAAEEAGWVAVAAQYGAAGPPGG